MDGGCTVKNATYKLDDDAYEFFWLIYEMYLRVICDDNIILVFVGSANFICMKNTTSNTTSELVQRLQIMMHGVIYHRFEYKLNATRMHVYCNDQ